MKFKFYFQLVVFFLPLVPIFAQDQLYVYSITGTAIVIRNNKIQKLKILDKLVEQDKLNLGPNSRISLVNVQNKKLYQISKPNTFIISEVLKNYPIDKSTSNKLIDYVINNFIEKGKVFHKEKDYSSVGMATRGVNKNLLLFPESGTNIYLSHSFVPRFDSTLVAMENMFQVSLDQNNKNLFKATIQQGDTLKIPSFSESGAPLVLTTKWRSFRFSIDLYLVNAEEKATYYSDLLAIDNDSVYLKNSVDKVLAKAIYLETKKCFIDASNFYDSLVIK